MSIIRQTRFFALAVTAPLLLFACDKREQEDQQAPQDKQVKQAKQSEQQGEDAAKPGEHMQGHEGMHHGHGDAATADVVEVEGGARVDVSVDASGYHPAEIKAPANSKLTLAFKRTTDQGCGQKLVIASMDVEKDLPLDESVEIEVEVPESGEVGFACGMNMYKGKVVPKS